MYTKFSGSYDSTSFFRINFGSGRSSDKPSWKFLPCSHETRRAEMIKYFIIGYKQREAETFQRTTAENQK